MLVKNFTSYTLNSVLTSAASALSIKAMADDIVFGEQLMGLAYFLGGVEQLSNKIFRFIRIFYDCGIPSRQ